MLKEDIFHFLCPLKMIHLKRILYCVDLKITLTTGLDIFKVQRKFLLMINININFNYYVMLYLIIIIRNTGLVIPVVFIMYIARF